MRHEIERVDPIHEVPSAPVREERDDSRHEACAESADRVIEAMVGLLRKTPATIGSIVRTGPKDALDWLADWPPDCPSGGPEPAPEVTGSRRESAHGSPRAMPARRSIIDPHRAGYATAVDARDQLRSLIEGTGEAELRELCIAALRRWHAKSNRSEFTLFGDLADELLPELKRRHKSEAEHHQLREHFVGSLSLRWMGPVVDFLWWLVRVGLTVPLGAQGNGDHVHRFHLTRAGHRFLEGSDDHPLLPGFVERLRVRCADVPDDVIELLVDAYACFDHGLGRPAIALVGVAFEHAVEAVAEALANPPHQLLQVVPTGAARRIAAVRGALDQRFPGNQNVEQRSAAGAACDFADDLRRRRNDASHTSPRWGFDDRQEVEELLVSAGRNLPSLWAIR